MLRPFCVSSEWAAGITLPNNGKEIGILCNKIAKNPYVQAELSAQSWKSHMYLYIPCEEGVSFKMEMEVCIYFSKWWK